MSPAVTAAPAVLQALRQWLLEELCPWWYERVYDARGGFHEGLDASGKAVDAPSQSILVQARLTYVFSHAFALSKSPAMAAASHHGFAHLQRWVGPAGHGWPRRRSLDGTVTDAARDTYDHAFVILACAWRHRASGDPAAIAIADRTFDFLKTELADPTQGGFFEEHPKLDTAPRRQNPHMHLLEATLAMHAATGQPSWLDASRQLVSLMQARLTDHGTGSLAEFFESDWAPASGHAGRLREPGHQFEWVWLLNEYARLSGERRVDELADNLFDFGVRHGIATAPPLAGLVVESVDREGPVISPASLFWPQTEYIKACVARADRGIAGMRDAALAHLARLREVHFRPDGFNWCNQLSATGSCSTPVTPARVLYHLFFAVAEIIRLEEARR